MPEESSAEHMLRVIFLESEGIYESKKEME
jgi:hypothetical protein